MKISAIWQALTLYFTLNKEIKKMQGDIETLRQEIQGLRDDFVAEQQRVDKEFAALEAKVSAPEPDVTDILKSVRDLRAGVNNFHSTAIAALTPAAPAEGGGATGGGS